MNLKIIPYVASAVVILGLGFKLGSCSRNNEVTDLSTKLSQSEKTIETNDGVYETKLEQLSNDAIQAVLIKQNLQKELDKLQGQLLDSQQVTLKWKSAYEAELAANQHHVPPPNQPPPDSGTCPTAGRDEVDFEGQLGPIHATGHTLTNPAEAHLKLEQTTPIVLTVAVAQTKDGSWTSLVTSSDDNIDVKVNLGAVNPQVLSPKWYQRLWADGGVTALGESGALLGASYRGDRFSLGALCMATTGGHGCGVTFGARIFK